VKRSNFLKTATAAVVASQIPLPKIAPAETVDPATISLPNFFIEDGSMEAMQASLRIAGIRLSLLAHRDVYEALGIDCGPEIKALEAKYLS